MDTCTDFILLVTGGRLTLAMQNRGSPPGPQRRARRGPRAPRGRVMLHVPVRVRFAPLSPTYLMLVYLSDACVGAIRFSN